MSETFISGADGNEVFQAKYIPKQKGPPPLDHPSMKAYISTYPALGQVTYIDKKITSTFVTLLEIDESRASNPWQVLLCHTEGREWYEVPMDPLRAESAFPTSLQKSPGFGLHRLYFATPLAFHLPTTFTIKFRSSSDQPWKTVQDHQGTQEGTIINQTVTDIKSLSSDLGDFITDLNPILESRSRVSQCPGTSLWSVQAPIEAADGENSTVKTIKLGVPWGKEGFSR